MKVVLTYFSRLQVTCHNLSCLQCRATTLHLQTHALNYYPVYIKQDLLRTACWPPELHGHKFMES